MKKVKAVLTAVGACLAVLLTLTLTVLFVQHFTALAGLLLLVLLLGIGIEIYKGELEDDQTTI